MKGLIVNKLYLNELSFYSIRLFYVNKYLLYNNNRIRVLAYHFADILIMLLILANLKARNHWIRLRIEFTKPVFKTCKPFISIHNLSAQLRARKFKYAQAFVLTIKFLLHYMAISN